MRVKRIVPGLLVALGAVGSPGPAAAVDGVTEINQARALAGGVTPGDGPGFPVTISASGSYRLTGSLDVGAGATAIVVTGDHVTLDLNGFKITAPQAADASPWPSGVEAYGAWLRIRNGTILGFLDGIISYSVPIIVDGVQVEGAGGYGIVSSGLSVISDSIAVGNAASGIWVGAASTVRGCTAINNAGIGIRAGASAQVTGNNVDGNGQEGIAVEGGSSVIGNDVDNNGTGLVYAAIHATDSTVLDNIVHNNQGLGIYFVGPSNGYARNVLSGNNGGGAQVGGPGTVIQTGTNVCGGAPC